MRRSTRDKIGRIFLIAFSILLILMGLADIMRGSLGWRNYWGGLLFPPFAILSGLLLIYVAVFRWRKLQEKPGDKKGRVPSTFEDDWRRW
jgi:hypothetical protein